MSVRLLPTLAVMADVYRLPKDGGAASRRFEAYVAAARAGAPVSAYNPMTSQPVLDTVEALLAIDAEALVEAAVVQTFERLGHRRDADVFITVATPGMWTDRIGTEVHHRLGSASGQVLLWTGEDVSAEAVRREAVAQAVRIAHDGRASVAEAAAVEGLAYALAGVEGAEDALVAEALEVVGDDPGLGTMAALLYGDDVATALGWTPLGLPWLAGYRHAIWAASVSPGG